jgi:alanine dehydrogenase
LRYAKLIADKGWKQACKDDRALSLGLNIVRGKVTHPAVAEAFDLQYTDHKKML